MNVASLDLCKELYELSGWYNTKFYLEDLGGGVSKLIDDQRLQQRWRHGDIAAPDAIPAYHLGYLMRKLPRYDYEGWNLTLECMGEEAVMAYYRHTDDRHRHEVIADIPEDAACKLAIQLFKQGILKQVSGEAKYGRQP